jgi:hypothetical protein
VQLLADYATGVVAEQSNSPQHPMLKRGLTQWDFEPLPSSLTIEQGSMQLPVWPAIKDQGKNVDIVFADSQAEAEALKVKALLAGRFGVPPEQVDVAVRANPSGIMELDSATISLTRRQLMNFS